MFKICLIQNQSEMAHYRFADLRKFLENHNFDYDLFTSENINQLTLHYEENHYDLIIFASNVFNDQIILNEVNSVTFQTLLANHTNQKKGLLITHQLNYAKKHHEFPFLPLNNEKLNLKLATNDHAKRIISFSKFASNHIIFNYPHVIKAEDILADALNSNQIKGAYWHTLNVNREEFNVLLEDKEPLFVLHPNKNIVVTSLLLDWQNHEKLLVNVISFLMRKALPIALIYEQEQASVKHEYVKRMLYNEQFELVSYDLNNDSDLLLERLEKQFHQILLFSEGMDINSLYYKNEEFKPLVINNDVRAITLNYEKGTFLLSGSANSLYDIGLSLELYIKNELATGYVEGSFWKTMETLYALRELNPTFDSVYPHNLKVLTDAIMPSVKNGAYNETFQVTCALLWFNHVILRDDKKTKATLEWLNDYSTALSHYDYLYLAYYKHLARLDEPHKNDVLKHFTSLLNDNPKDLDLFVLIFTAHHYELGNENIYKVLALLHSQLDNYLWLNLLNTINIASVLVDLFKEYKLDKASKLMLFDIIIKLRELVEKSPLVKGKFDIVVFSKALAVCSVFEDVIDYPTNELFTLIDPKDETNVVTKTDLMNAELMRGRYYKMQKAHKHNKVELMKLRFHNNTIISLAYVTFVSLYSLIVMGIFVSQKDPNLTLFNFIKQTWAYHVTIFPICLTVIGFVIRFLRQTFPAQPIKEE